MEKPLTILALLILLSVTAAAANFTVETLDSNGDRLNVEYEILLNGQTVESSSGLLEAELDTAEQYKLIAEPEQGPGTIFYNFSISESLDMKPRIFKHELPEGEQFLADTDLLYFNNQSFSFDKAEITAERDQPDRIAQCTEFQGLECQEWRLNDTTDFETNFDSGANEFSYNVTSFSAYTSGNNASLPVIENIQIFDVTDETDQRTGGQLIDEGRNKTFEINQSDSRDYRFSFEVSNQGSDDWVLTSSDTLIHRGLNQSWSVEDIYYDIDGIEEGGEFSSGEVEWSTGNGGTLETGEHLTAEYIANITQGSTNTFEQGFEASTTENTEDIDLHELEILILGVLDPVLTDPQDGSVVQKDREFSMSGFVDCLEGDCGDISFEPRRNESGGQVEFNGQFFEVTGLETQNCVDLREDERCEVEWNVNATGEEGSNHLLDFEASSSYEIESEPSNVTEVSIEEILLIDLGWSVVDFGLLDPGDRERPAENNSEGYSLTVDEESNSIDQLWVRGDDLVSQEDDSYSIGIGNMSYARENNVEASENMTLSFSLVEENLEPGTVLDFYYWLNVPYGIIRGAYTGSITFKANSTEA